MALILRDFISFEPIQFSTVDKVRLFFVCFCFLHKTASFLTKGKLTTCHISWCLQWCAVFTLLPLKDKYFATSYFSALLYVVCLFVCLN